MKKCFTIGPPLLISEVCQNRVDVLSKKKSPTKKLVLFPEFVFMNITSGSPPPCQGIIYQASVVCVCVYEHACIRVVMYRPPTSILPISFHSGLDCLSNIGP
jgi:hypothetical protein